MKTRIITAIVGIIVLIGVMFTFNTLIFNLVIAAITLIAIHEIYNVLATIVYTNEPKKDFDWYDGLKLLHLIDFAAWQQWCDA